VSAGTTKGEGQTPRDRGMGGKFGKTGRFGGKPKTFCLCLGVYDGGGRQKVWPEKVSNSREKRQFGCCDKLGARPRKGSISSLVA